MISTSAKNNGLSAALVSNLQDVLSKRKGGNEEKAVSDGSAEEAPSTSDSVDVAEKEVEEIDDSRPIVLVTNGDGIDSPGLVSLVEALVSEGIYNVHVCAPQTDKSASAHSVTPGETIAASSADIKGATAFEVSGTPVDCISLGLLIRCKGYTSGGRREQSWRKSQLWKLTTLRINKERKEQRLG